ncbi:MAG TPA: PLP-dependent aminotransferase family protein [Epulopiscium sp.]|nr:PLP-dependent aminotransferase family protein [Candidatus Epulonipiscium sp.]
MFNTIQLAKSSPSPLYLQLANGLSQLIETGQLPSGTKLPSIRSLARELKINRDTVVSAYNLLEQRGLAYGQTGRGTYVSPPPNLPSLNTPTLEPFFLAHKDCINFSSISLPDDCFPIAALEEVVLGVLSNQQWDAFYDYDGTQSQRLLEEICNYFKTQLIQATPKQIRIIQSISQLIQSLPKFTNRPGICVESPSMDLSIFKEYGFEPFEVPLDQDGMNMEVLECHLKTGKIQYVYVMPCLQNPTGICYSKQRKQHLLTLAKAYNVYVIETDIFSDLLLKDSSYVPLYFQTSDKNVIYIKYFSQLYLPNLHYSFVVLPNALSNINTKSHPYNFTDSIFYTFLHTHIWQVHKQHLMKHYNEKYLTVCYLIDLHLSSYISYTSKFGGIYIWLTLETPHITLDDLCDALIAHHILVSPGTLFFTHKTNPPCMRLSIARTSMAQIERGIKVMGFILSQSLI